MYPSIFTCILRSTFVCRYEDLDVFLANNYSNAAFCPVPQSPKGTRSDHTTCLTFLKSSLNESLNDRSSDVGLSDIGWIPSRILNISISPSNAIVVCLIEREQVLSTATNF